MRFVGARSLDGWLHQPDGGRAAVSSNIMLFEKMNRQDSRWTIGTHIVPFGRSMNEIFLFLHAEDESNEAVKWIWCISQTETLRKTWHLSASDIYLRQRFQIPIRSKRKSIQVNDSKWRTSRANPSAGNIHRPISKPSRDILPQNTARAKRLSHLLSGCLFLLA